MPKFIGRHSVQLTALNQTFDLRLSLLAQDVALRVLCRYEPEQVPPPPTVVVMAVEEIPDPDPTAVTIRKFMLIPEGEELPTDFAKYIGGVPFGDAKHLCYIIELLAVNTTIQIPSH
jgi:hypothetical protein